MVVNSTVGLRVRAGSEPDRTQGPGIDLVEERNLAGPLVRFVLGRALAECARWHDEGIPIGVTRIGVHCGPAVVGNFGSQQRMDFTALGDTVNTAARCEGVNKYFGTRICATQPIVDQCRTVRFRPIGDVVLKGKTEAVTLYNPVTEEYAASPAYTDYMDTYALLKAEATGAADAVRELKRRYPDDPLVDFHLERAAAGICSARVVMEDK